MTMTMEDLARRLDAAADQLAEIETDLRRHDLAPAAHGRAAREVAAALRLAWTAHTERATRLTADLTALSTSVRLAATHYRAADGETS